MNSQTLPLSKDYWMPDNNGSSCYKCEKSFNSFRRRHHCRNCGLLFCGKCSKKNFEIDRDTILDRVCDNCISLLDTPIIKNRQSLVHYPYFPKDTLLYTEDEIEDTNTETNIESCVDVQPYLNDDSDVYAENNEEFDFTGNENTELYLKNQCEIQLNEISCEDWVENTMSVIKEIVTNIILKKKDRMNINNYLKIICLPFENHCKFFRGIGFKKTLANKRMPKSIINPRILILKNSTGFCLGDSKIVCMQKLIDQEEHYTRSVIGLITNIIKPNLILIEKSMPFDIIEKLSRADVSVLINVNNKKLQLVSRLSKATILDSVYQSYSQQNYLGTCAQFWQQKNEEKIYCFFRGNEAGIPCGTLILNSGPHEKKPLKSKISKLCLQYRSVILENKLLSLYFVKKIKYEDFHSFKASFIYLSTCKGRICLRPKIHEVEYYKKKGKPLGEYLEYNLSKFSQKCENNCGKKLFHHKYYYFKGKGRVKITYHRPDMFGEGLKTFRLCTVCIKKSEPQLLSSEAWMYSFNKFIDNFFQTGLIEHETCEDEFYNHGKFIFTSNTHSIAVQYEENVQYSKHQDKTYRPGVIKYIKEASLSKLFESGSSLIRDLGPMKEYVYKLSLNEFTDDNLPEDCIVLNRSHQVIEEAFTSLENLFSSIESTHVENYLQVEGLRRRFFISCCRVLVGLEGARDVVRKMGQRKKSDTIDYSLLETPIYNTNDFFLLTSGLSDEFDLLTSKNFQYLKHGLPTFPVRDPDIFIPVDEDDSLSIISYALSSHEYYSQIQEHFQNDPEKIESDLLSAKDDHFVFTQSNSIEDELKDSSHRESFLKLYGDYVTIKVTAYFYKQFHSMREYCVGSHIDFLLSISKSKDEVLHLGKSKSLFKNSIDERFIVKIVGEKQFRMFIDFAPNYFRHNCKNKFHQMPSCLVKILGAYQVQLKNHTTGKYRQEWIFINENLCYSMPKSSLVFDLKGTINKRRKVYEGDEKTKMDLNFIEYMDGLPLIIKPEDKQNFDAEVWNDTLFLYQQNIVDYSLLLVLDTENFKFNYGIIDYLEQYTFERAIESKYKTVVGTELPTIIYPKEYKNRFRQHLIQIYFMSV